MYAVYWLIAAAVFLLVEIFTLGLTSIWFAGGAVLAAAAVLVGGPFWLQFVVFIAVSTLLFVLTRPIAKKYLNQRVQKTNAEALIGKTGLVKEGIDNIQGRGVVQIDGLDWTARSTDGSEISEGTKVIIQEIQGVKLIVESKSEV